MRHFDFDQDQSAEIESVSEGVGLADRAEVASSITRLPEALRGFALHCIRSEIRQQARLAMFARTTAATVERLELGELRQGRQAWARWLYEELLRPAPVWDDERWSKHADVMPALMIVAGGLGEEAAERILSEGGGGTDERTMGPFSLN